MSAGGNPGVDKTGKGVNWGHAKTSETIEKLGYMGTSVAQLPEMTTASVNPMARPEEMTELD